jgi:glyoxylase-like metal-dependent hydrolase (beta-lactamase superfamily II)
MYEVFTLKNGERESEASGIFLRMDYGKKFVTVYCFWLVKSKNRNILVDTGISQEELNARGIVGPTQEEMLGRLKLKPADIDTVILSHIHGDHFANAEIYTKAVFYVQRKEVEFWTGEIQSFPALNKPPFLHGRTSADIETFQKLNAAGRIKFLDGDCELFPGISVILTGAHTPGHQIVKIETAKGPVLLCADFADAYRNVEERIPIGNFTNLMEWMSGLSRIERMNLPKELIVPGHDSLVMTRFPEVAKDIVKIA